MKNYQSSRFSYIFSVSKSTMYALVAQLGISKVEWLLWGNRVMSLLRFIEQNNNSPENIIVAAEESDRVKNMARLIVNKFCIEEDLDSEWIYSYCDNKRRFY